MPRIRVIPRFARWKQDRIFARGFMIGVMSSVFGLLLGSAAGTIAAYRFGPNAFEAAVWGCLLVLVVATPGVLVWRLRAQLGPDSRAHVQLGTAYGAGLASAPAIIGAPALLLSSHDRGYVMLCLVACGALVGTASGVAWAAGRLIRLLAPHDRFQDGTLCPGCGYCLLGNTSMVCPECGRPFYWDELQA
jgi:hypothetical protein